MGQIFQRVGFLRAHPWTEGRLRGMALREARPTESHPCKERRPRNGAAISNNLKDRREVSREAGGGIKAERNLLGQGRVERRREEWLRQR